MFLFYTFEPGDWLSSPVDFSLSLSFFVHSFLVLGTNVKKTKKKKIYKTNYNSSVVRINENKVYLTSFALHTHFAPLNLIPIYSYSGFIAQQWGCTDMSDKKSIKYQAIGVTQIFTTNIPSLPYIENSFELIIYEIKKQPTRVCKLLGSYRPRTTKILWKFGHQQG